MRKKRFGGLSSRRKKEKSRTSFVCGGANGFGEKIIGKDRRKRKEGGVFFYINCEGGEMWSGEVVSLKPKTKWLHIQGGEKEGGGGGRTGIVSEEGGAYAVGGGRGGEVVIGGQNYAGAQQGKGRKAWLVERGVERSKKKRDVDSLMKRGKEEDVSGLTARKGGALKNWGASGIR